MEFKGENRLFHHVEKWAGRKPEAQALVFGDESLSFRQFKEEVDRIAMALIDAGVAANDKVAMLSMARNEFMTTFMAAGKIGAVWLGLNPKSTVDELKYILADCRPKVLMALRRFGGNDLAETISGLKREMPFIEKVLVLGEPFDGAENFHEYVSRPRAHLSADLEKRAADVRPGDDALLMYTSGSTGKPKGVVHTHGSIVENIRVEVESFAMGEDLRALLHFPINHVAADVEIGFATVFSGGCLVFMDSFDPVESLKMIEKEKLSLLGQVPVMFLMQMQQPVFRQVDLSSLKVIAWAGAAAPKVMLDGLMQLCEKTGAKLVTGYGSTEVAGFVTYTRLNDRPELLEKSVGKIAEPFELKIVDENRNTVEDGATGELAVRGPFLFNKYLNRPEDTARVVDEDGWYYTDDLGYRDTSGYVFLTGRKSEMYKTGGENVYPREIEEVLETHPDVLFAAVIGVADEIYQEVGWAFVMPKPGLEVGEDDLHRLCREKLSNFKVPKKFIVRAMLPLLPNGKVNKVALKAEIEAS